MNKKVTPEIERFIQSNCKLTSTALAGLIGQKFDIQISYRAIDPYLERFRAAAEAENNARVEAVRSAILEDADKYAGKYLSYLDEEIEAWKAILTTGQQTFPDGEKIKIKSIKARSEASQTMLKLIESITEFAKPSDAPNVNVTVNEDVQARMARYKAYFEGLKNESRADKVPG